MRRRPLGADGPFDLDATDELPALDVPASEPEDDLLARTGEWTLPTAEATPGVLAVTGPSAPCADASDPPDGAIAALTSALREKSFAIARIEREREAARAEAERLRASLAALQGRVADLEAELAMARRRLVVEAARAAELESKLQAREAERVALRAALEPPAQPLDPADRAVPPRVALPKRYLVRLDDPSAPLRVLAERRVTVGRTADNDLRLEEDWMSRHHAVLWLDPDTMIVEDCGSTNGVFVNRRRVRREALRDGDELAFGRARFRFHEHRPGGRD